MMMGFLLIVLPIGSVQLGQVLAILNLLIPQIQNMGLKTWLCFITDVPSTVFSVRIGHIEKGFGIRKGSLLKNSSKQWMTVPVVSVISVGTPLHNFLTPSEFLKRP
jgi:hypothetical protein